MPPMLSSSRNCLHSLATWGQALLCTSQYLTAVRVLLDSTWRYVQPFKDIHPRPSLTNCQTGHAGWSCQKPTIPTASKDFFTSVTYVGCEPALICEENRGRLANSGVLWHVPIKLHSARVWEQDRQEVDGPSWHPHGACFWPSGSLLKVSLQGSGSASPVSPHTMEKILKLLLGCCPSDWVAGTAS